jgi:hypothetical protein
MSFRSIEPNDLLEGNTVLDEFQNVLDGDPGSRQIRLAEVNRWVYIDPIEH